MTHAVILPDTGYCAEKMQKSTKRREPTATASTPTSSTEAATATTIPLTAAKTT